MPTARTVPAIPEHLAPRLQALEIRYRVERMTAKLDALVQERK